MESSQFLNVSTQLTIRGKGIHIVLATCFPSKEKRRYRKGMKSKSYVYLSIRETNQLLKSYTLQVSLIDSGVYCSFWFYFILGREKERLVHTLLDDMNEYAVPRLGM